MQFRDLKERNKIIVMAVLFLCAGFISWYYHAILQTDIIFTHLFYIPIVLASIWWKRRGIALAVLLGAFLVVTHVVFSPDTSPVPDLFRAAMFVVIAAVVAVLSEQIAAAVLLYKTLGGSSHTGVYILQNGKLRYVNQHAQEYTGYSEEEMLRMFPLEWIHPDDREEAQKNAVEMLKGVRKAPYEFRVISRDGRIKWILETVTPIQFRGRKAVLGNAMDITERRKKEDVLEKYRTRMELILKSVGEGVYGVDVHGDTTFVNPSAAELTGYSAEEMIGRDLHDIIHHSGPDGTPYPPEECKVHLTVKDGVARRVMDEVFWKRDGTFFFVEYVVTPILGKEGIAGAVVAFRDITERKQAEGLLRESEEKYRTILENIEDGYHEVNLAGSFTFFNESFREIMGYTSDELMGMNYRHYAADEENARKVFLAYNKIFKTGKPARRLEWDIIRKDGKRRTVEVSASLIRDAEGRPTGFRGIVRDTTKRMLAERKLRESESRQKAILSNIPDIAWLKDSESRFVAVNEPFGKACGVSPDQLVGKTDLDIWPRELAERYRADDREVMKSGLRKCIEEPLIDKEGSATWVETMKTPIWNEKGEIIGTAGIARDITERRRAEEALKKSEALHREAQATAHIGHWELDTSRMTPTWSEEIYHIFGLDHKKQEPSFAMHQKITHPDDWNILKNAVTKSIAEGTSFDIEFRIVRPDKTIRWMHAIGYARKDSQGRVERLFGTAQDITERKQAEARLFELQRQIEFILGASKTGMDIIDKDFNLRYVDSQWQKIYGNPAGRKCFEYFMGRDTPCPGCGIPRALQTKKPMVTEEILVREGNRPIQVTTIPFQDESGEWLVAEINVDITERKEFEARLLEARKMAAIGSLASGAAHEIRNPLNIMSLRLQMLDVTGKVLDDNVRKAIDTCHTQISRIISVLEGLQEFSRMPFMDKRLDDINKIIGGVVDSFDTKFKNEGVTPEIRYGKDIPPFMFDKEKIATVINHLVSNAVDAMKDRETKRLGISTEKTPTGESVRIIISDTGHGLNETDRARIFDPFFTTKDPDKGKGLGLSIAYRIISDHGGTIRAENNEQGGATFIVELPA